MTVGISFSEYFIGLPKTSASTDKSITVTAALELYFFASV
jgi:hypothetical protein